MSQLRSRVVGPGSADVLVLGAGRAGTAAASAALGLRIDSDGALIPSAGTDRADSVRVVLVDGAPVGRAGWDGRAPLSTLAAVMAEGADWERARQEMLNRRRQSQPRHDALLAQLREASGGRLTVVPGRARFTGRGRVLVRPRGSVGDEQVSLIGQRIVVATGSTTARPRARGLDETRYAAVGELDLLFEEEDPPASVAVIGAGPSGCATAQLLARLGIGVTLVEAAERVLPREDPEVAALVDRTLAKDGVRVMTSLAVSTVAPTLDGGAWFGTQDGGDIAAERLVVATGWQPDTEGLDLSAAGVPVTRRGAIVVDERLAAGSGAVLAAGSVTGSRPHPREAVAMGRTAGANALRRRSPTPWVAGAAPYRSATDPVFVRVGTGVGDLPGVSVGYAQVGEGAQAQRVWVRVADGAGGGAGAASARGRRLRLCWGRRSGAVRPRRAGDGSSRLLGVTVAGPGAENLAALPALAMQSGVPVERLRELTVTEGADVRVLQQALESLRVPSGVSVRPTNRR